MDPLQAAALRDAASLIADLQAIIPFSNICIYMPRSRIPFNPASLHQERCSGSFPLSRLGNLPHPCNSSMMEGKAQLSCLLRGTAGFGGVWKTPEEISLSPLSPPGPSCSPISQIPTLVLDAPCCINPSRQGRGEKTIIILKIHVKKKEKGRRIKSEKKGCARHCYYQCQELDPSPAVSSRLRVVNKRGIKI